MKTFFKILLAAGVFVSGSAVDCDDQFHHEGNQCTGCHPKCTKMCGKTDANSVACGNTCQSPDKACSKHHGTACNCDAEDCSPKCNPNVRQFFFSLLLPNWFDFSSVSICFCVCVYCFLFFVFCFSVILITRLKIFFLLLSLFTEISPVRRRLYWTGQGVSPDSRLCLLWSSLWLDQLWALKYIYQRQRHWQHYALRLKSTNGETTID